MQNAKRRVVKIHHTVKIFVLCFLVYYVTNVYSK